MSLLPVGFGASGDYGITDSLRFRSSASAYLSRTPASAGNRRTWTLSWWAKRGALGSTGFTVFSAGTGTSGDTGELVIKYDNNYPDSLAIQTTNTNVRFTNALYRDSSAWHHVVVAFDTTQATASNRTKVYVNGAQITSFNISNDLTQNTDTAVNNNVTQEIGVFARINSQYFDGYLTEVQMIDGQQLDADDFGEYDTNGTWKAKEYTGTYGTNGFYLNGVGVTDQSGNSNNWTNNNLNLSTSTAATYDQMKDTPSLVDENAGNFATLNPVDSYASGLSNGNLTFTNGSGAAYKGISTFVIEDIADSQKYYVEYISDAGYLSGIVTTANSGSASNASYSDIRGYYSNGNKYTGTSASSYGGAFTSSDKLAMLIGDGKLEFFKNNVSQGVAFTGLTGSWKVATAAFGSAGVGVSYNFGQRPFAYTPPTGSKKLNTFNLPDSTIEDGSDYFNTVLYSGNSSTQSITGVGFQPDFVWAKDRTNVVHHTLNDAVRGVNLDLFTSSTSVESNDHAGLTAFTADGYNLSSSTNHNVTGHTYVGWNWKANGSGVSNTDGSITSTVSANTTAGFSIVSYTGSGSTSTVGHGLGVAPNVIIWKGRNYSVNWAVYHSSIGEGSKVYLDLTNVSAADTTYMNNTAPTSTVFSIASNAWTNNSASATLIAYCFAEVAGYSKFDKYTGNGSTDGPFVYTGFRPAFIITKNSSGTGGWHMTDTTRFAFNSSSQMGYLDADTASAEVAARIYNSFSNGFKIRDNGSVVNTSGSTYIYMAFAENPFKNALAR